MKSTTVITTTMSNSLVLWLDSHSKKRKTTKRAIIEHALCAYREAVKKKELKEMFLRAKDGPEMHKIAEEGLDDYLDHLKQYEA